ncbi:NADH-cytochrome reductase-like protein, partial [Sesamum angolense]
LDGIWDCEIGNLHKENIPDTGMGTVSPLEHHNCHLVFFFLLQLLIFHATHPIHISSQLPPLVLSSAISIISSCLPQNQFSNWTNFNLDFAFSFGRLLQHQFFPEKENLGSENIEKECKCLRSKTCLPNLPGPLLINLSRIQVYLDQPNEDSAPKVALNPDKWIEFKLQDKVQASHNSQLFRFSFDPSAKLGLDVASCIITRAPMGQNAEGKPKYVIRPYTPISDPDAKGYFDLLIKVYPEGKMSQHFASLKPGDVVEVKGPIEKLRYSPNMKKHIGMIAGGTGITPMLQIIDAILKNPDNTQIFYTVDNPTKDWLGGKGYISKDMVVKGLPSPSDDTLILVCGPPGLMKHISGDKAKDRSQGQLTGILKELGYTEDMVYKF